MDEVKFFDIVYSVAGQRNVDHVYRKLKAVNLELLDDKEEEILKVMLDAYEDNDMFPTYAFLKRTYDIEHERSVRNKSDLETALKNFVETRRRDLAKIQLNEAQSLETFSEIQKKVRELADKNQSTIYHKVEIFDSSKKIYDAAADLDGGIRSGVSCIDDLTGGFQPGTVFTVGAWTSHGKSMVMNNAAYLNALNGKKGIIISLEIVKELVYMILQSRHSHKTKNPIPYEWVLKRELRKKEYEYFFGELEESFKEKIAPNLLVFGTEDIPGYDYSGLMELYSAAEEQLGWLDFVIWDHVNMFEYIPLGFKETANHVIKTLVDLTTSYVNKNGHRITTGMAAQTNRAGYTKAKRNNGQYDMTAISDFHEIERGSTYVVFAFAEREDMQNESMIIQLQKNRLGPTMLEPETISTSPAYSVTGEAFVQKVRNVEEHTREEQMDQLLDEESEIDIEEGLTGGGGLDNDF